MINYCGEEVNIYFGLCWKCFFFCEDGWEGVGFDDSSWNIASNLGINGNLLWSHHEVLDSAYCESARLPAELWTELSSVAQRGPFRARDLERRGWAAWRVG